MPSICYTIDDIKKILAEKESVPIESVHIVEDGDISVGHGMHGRDLSDGDFLFEIEKS